MSAPAPLEAYVCHADGSAFHHATLYDPATGKVLMTAQERGHDAALERLLRLKAHSRVSRRRYVVKSNRPKAVLGLLELIDLAEVDLALDTNSDATHVPLPIEDFHARLRDAIAAMEAAPQFASLT